MQLQEDFTPILFGLADSNDHTRDSGVKRKTPLRKIELIQQVTTTAKFFQSVFSPFLAFHGLVFC